MRYIFLFLTLIIHTLCFSQNKNCNANSDMKYNRLHTLTTISKRLNKMNEFYQIEMGRKFSVTKEDFYNFFIYDLVDISNQTPNKENNCIEFIDEHVYHIAALRSTFKVSIILVLLKGKLYFFEGINCSKNINTIEEVLNFVKTNTSISDENIFNRIVNYQDYNLSYAVDPVGKTPKCKRTF